MSDILKRYVLGDEVLVRAWWTTPKDQTVACRLEAVQGADQNRGYGESATVRPLTGANPHTRYVEALAILGPVPPQSVSQRDGTGKMGS